MNHDAQLPAVRFDASDAAPHERLERWRAHVAPALEICLPQDHAPADWSVATSGWNVGGTMMVVGRYGAQTLVRSQRAIRADHLDHYVLHLSLAASALWADVAGRRLEVAPGRLLLTDFGQPKSLTCSGEVLSLFIPRDALDPLLPRPFDLHGVLLDGACSVILAGHLRSLSTLLPRMTRREAPDAMQATVQLLAASLAPSVDRLGLARPAQEGTLLKQICRFMEDHLTEEDLGTDRICAQFRISRSTLYRLFESAGGVANHLKERRLIRIHGLLASPVRRHYMGRIAEDHGFKSAAHFSRVFREKFGYSPREAKAAKPAPAPGGAGVSMADSIGGWLSRLAAGGLPQRPLPAAAGS